MNALTPPPPTRQSMFASALFDPAFDVSATLRAGTCTATSLRCFDVHRNTVMSSLVRALAEGFPSIERLVGPAFFPAMAAEFVRAHPPSTPVLLAFGDGFAGFLERFGPVAHLPYLADVARLDGLRRRAWHAADVPALSVESLAGAEPDHLAGRRIALHPGVGLLGSPHPARTLWQAQNGAESLQPIEWIAEITLVRRDGDAIRVDAIDTALLALLDAARRRPTLTELLAVESGRDYDDAAHAQARAFAIALRNCLLVDAAALDDAMARVPDAALFDGFLPPFPRSPNPGAPR